MIGFVYDSSIDPKDIFGYNYGAFVLELADDSEVGVPLGMTTPDAFIRYAGVKLPLETLLNTYEAKLESVYPCNIPQGSGRIKKIKYETRSLIKPRERTAHPRVFIPVFPGTNCEYDSAKAVAKAGAIPEILVINNQTAKDTAESVDRAAEAISRSQAIFIPGGFSGGGRTRRIGQVHHGILPQCEDQGCRA